MVGIVIGTTIFKFPGVIAGNTASATQLFGLWLLGGVLALIGALCYAELGATYGAAGGDYHYQTRAFGSWAGFLFGWTQFVVIQTVNIAMFASVFAEYAWKTYSPQQAATLSPLGLNLTAAATVAAVTAVNLIGLQSGKITQNLLTAGKIAGIALLLLAAVFVRPHEASEHVAKTSGDWTVALIMILYAYGGWNDAAFVTNEIRDRPRNVPRALTAGVGLVTLIYLAVNAAYVGVLGFAGLQHADDPPLALLTGWWGEPGARAMSAIVMISALGAVNGLILSVSRLHAAVGRDHRLFALMGRWSNRHEAPIGSLVIQAAFVVALLMLVGTPAGQALLDRFFAATLGQTLPWGRFGGGFDLLFAVGAPVFWTFFLATGLAFLVLRIREPHIERPFRAPGFPVTPLLFCAMCGFGIFASVRYAGTFTWLGVAPVIAGLAIYSIEMLTWGPKKSEK